MPYRTRKRSFQRSLIRVAKRLGLAVLLVLAAVAVTLILRSQLSKDKPVAQLAPPLLAVAETTVPPEPAKADSEIAGVYYGLCKKNSIHSVADFRKTVLSDAVLSDHFAGFDWDSAKLGKLDKELFTYVSYRKRGDIKRTSKPVRLPKGDGYITDGSFTVRTYCCNDYVVAPAPSEVSMAAPAAPPPVVTRVDGPPRRIDALAVADGAVAILDPPETLPEPLRRPGSFVPPPYFGGSSGPIFLPYTSNKHGRHPTTVVPEPGTFVLLGAGVLLMGLFGLRQRKPAARD